MPTKTKQPRRLQRYHILLALLLLYLISTVGYYSLPWSVRKTVYYNAPELDRMLVRNGFRIVTGWDQLGLWGRDCRAEFTSKDRLDQTYGGYPSQGLQLFDRVKVLENVGYTVGYSEALRAPLWVVYRVFDVPVLDSGKRPSGFRIDHRTKAQVAHGDYTHSGYDRGHMAPNYAIATRYGRYAQRETFLMSNIIPQKPNINRHLWKDLEMLVAKRYGQYLNEIWVITGPVYRKPIKRLESEVAIPSGYYKILIDQNDDEVRVKAFLVQNDCPPYSRVKSQLVSIDQLEELTHLDFFPELSSETQAALESKPAGRLWPWIGPAIKHAFSK
jgi:DNA/RNA endonuclease G (NUC1)